MHPITVQKLDPGGKLVIAYPGEALERDETHVVLQALWQRGRLDLGYVTFEPGDRFVEFFYADRWYNIFEIHDRQDDTLKGWYCNLSRPAVLQADLISAVDLALDMFVYPDGRTLTLDQDEFDALALPERDPAAWQQVQSAVAELRQMVAARRPPFTAAGAGGGLA